MTTLSPSGPTSGRPPKRTSSTSVWAEAEEIAGVGFWELDAATGEITWSPGMFFLFGLDPADVAPAEILPNCCCHPDDAPRHEEALVRAFLDGELYALDLRLVKDGDVRWVQARGRAVQDDYRRVIKLIGTLVDVTERKEAELAREASRGQTRRLLEQANCLLWEAEVREVFPWEGWEGLPFDPERGTTLDWDLHVVNEEEVPSWLPIDREQGETVTHAWLRSRDPEDSAITDLHSTVALQSGWPRYTQTFRNRLADGSILWTFEDVRIEKLPSVPQPQEEKSGTFDGSQEAKWLMRCWRLTGVVTDVTEWKLAELEREAALRELETSRTQLQRVMEQANCLLWQGTVREICPVPSGRRPFDPIRGTALFWDLDIVNEAEVVRWLPIPRNEGEPLSHAMSRARYPDDNQRCNDCGRNALASGAERYTQAFRVFLADGSIRWLQEDVRVEEREPASEISATGERLRCWNLIGVMTDVTEQKLAEERLQRLADDLSRSNAALQEFAYVASHDLKEPLRKIETFGDLLRRQAGPYLNPDARGYLDRMTNAANRMQSLIQALLEYSRVTTKPAPFEPVDLNALAAAVVSDLEVRIAEVDGAIEVDDLPTVQADSSQMRQLFQNLLANALKFRRESVPPVVRVTAEWGREEFLLTFTDNGIGFAAEYAERIFSMFERLHGRSEYEGSGIGPAICRKIAERHGGTVTAEGRPGEGATFYVTLRVSHPVSDGASAASPPAMPQG